MCGILLIDQNTYTDIFSVGAASGVQNISVTSSSIPKINNSNHTITIDIAAWGNLTFITTEDNITIE